MYKFFSKGELDLLRSHESLWMRRERKDNGGDKQLEGQVGLEERKTKGTERCEKGSQQKQVEGEWVLRWGMVRPHSWLRENRRSIQNSQVIAREVESWKGTAAMPVIPYKMKMATVMGSEITDLCVWSERSRINKGFMGSGVRGRKLGR